jgi:TrmH family RNA methyltransferase
LNILPEKLLTTNEIKVFASLKQKKFRKEHGKFLIEGFHLIEECLNSDHELEYIIVRSDVNLQGYPEILEKIAKNKTIVEPLPEKLFNKLTDTESSQGIVGVVKRPIQKVNAREQKIIMVLDKISDPGNLGTLIRTSYWFGVKTILLSEDSADPYNPKVIRSTQGGIFHTDVIEDADIPEILLSRQAEGYRIYLFTLTAERFLDEIRKDMETFKNEKIILVFGNEAHGISEKILALKFDQIKIRGYSECESLNAAVSGAIALYEFTK